MAAATHPEEPSAWYWPNTSGLETRPLRFSGRQGADVAVIGAGYTGLSCALGCARANLRTVVLEAARPGYGASGRNAGQWLPGWVGKTPDDVRRIFGPQRGDDANRLLAGAVDLVRELVRGREPAVDFRDCGIVQVSRGRRPLEKLHALADQWARYGLEIEKLGADTVKGYVVTDRYAGGILFRAAGTLNPYAYANCLAAAGQAAGAAVYSHSPATAVKRRAGDWQVDTPAGTLQARSLIIATNAYTPAALWPGLERGCYRFSLPVLVSAPLADGGISFLPRRTPFAELGLSGLFGGMLTADGRWLASAMPLARGDAGMAAIGAWPARRFRRTFPQAPAFEWDQLWWGDVAVTTSGLPKIVKLADDLYTAFGYSGGGILLATAIGRELAKIVAERDERASSYPVSQWRAVPMPVLLPMLARRVLLPGLRWVEKSILFYR